MLAIEESLLRRIADHPADDLPRMVYADWLEERGEDARAELIRVQCEVGSPNLSEAQKASLKLRERELLDTHRQKWIAALGVPVEDVRFERGMITAIRLPNWQSFNDLRFAAVTELDLSETGMGDAGLGLFAERARFPGLKKLMLNGNGITNAGAVTFANAHGMPQLTTAYIFDNGIDFGGYSMIESSSKFTLADLDHGEPAEGYRYSSGQTDALRRSFLREQLLPFVHGYFERYKRLQSAALCVAQYWDDEANDAVHGNIVLSELSEPVFVGARTSDYKDAPLDPNVPNTRIERERGRGGSTIRMYETELPWHDNGDAIPLWSAFAPEGGNQNYDELSDVYAPAVMFYRHGGYDSLPMRRSHLDGILPDGSNE